MKLIRQSVALLFLIGFLGMGALALLSFSGISLSFFQPLEKLPFPKTPVFIGTAPSPTPKPVKFTIALVADSHNENDLLASALNKAKAQGAKLVVGLGDYTQVGSAQELLKVKQTLAASDLPHYLIPGDHDLWHGREQGLDAHAYFNQAFGWRPGSQAYQEFSVDGVRFILVDNADNELGISQEQWDWLTRVLPQVPQGVPLQGGMTFVLMHEMPYHPYSEHVMGKVRENVAKQAERLRSLLGQRAVTHVLTGDLHFFAQFQDPEHTVMYTSIGAVTRSRNAQAPRFAQLSIFEDGTYEIKDIEIE